MRALLLEGIHPDAVTRLKAAAVEVEILGRALDENELIERMAGVNLLGIRSKTNVTAAVLAAAPELTAIGAFCIGTDQIDLVAAAAGGIAVFNAPFSNTRGVVELALAEIIALTRRLTEKNTGMHAGLWDKAAEGSHEVRGRTLGIVGYGNIGTQLSVLAENLGMSVYFYDTADKLALGNARRCATLDELLEVADVVTLHVDGRPGNSGFFGEEQFARMRPRSLFLNLSRGFVIDHVALRKHLETGHLAGAAVDVFPTEPKGRGDEFHSELRGLSNVILTPHIGGSTEEAQADIGAFVANKLAQYAVEGATTLSVNLPSVTLPQQPGTHRVAHIHHNTPGVLAAVNGILAEHGVNVEGQLLATRGEVGYLLTDIATDYAEDVVAKLREMPQTISLRVLSVTLEATLRAVVGDSHVLVDPDLRAPYEVDWTRRFHGSARCVVRPADTEQVAAVVRACAGAGVPVTTQGGNTGLVGGGVPAGDDVLLSLSRLTTLAPVDAVAGQVTVGAGARLEAVQQHARAAGLDFGVDLAARSQASVGGLIATNAGGVRVVRHGSMRNQVAGLEAVLADGTVVSRLAPPAKDNTGYDLTQLLCGSEGTLAVITQARLRLVAPAGAQAVALVGVDSTTDALTLLGAARAGLNTLTAAEIFFADGLALVRAAGGLPAPFPAEFTTYVVLECAGRTDPTDELLELLAASDVVGEATVAADPAGRARLWAYRETHTESIGTLGVPVKLDVCVPLRELPALVEALPRTVTEVSPIARTIYFGHLNEGNLHVNVLGADAHEEEVTDAVLALVASLGGSISSEHGVGRAKAPWLHLSRSAAEIDAMRRVKAAFDPAGLLNPGVLLPRSGADQGHS